MQINGLTGSAGPYGLVVGCSIRFRWVFRYPANQLQTPKTCKIPESLFHFLQLGVARYLLTFACLFTRCSCNSFRAPLTSPSRTQQTASSFVESYTLTSFYTHAGDVHDTCKKDTSIGGGARTQYQQRQNEQKQYPQEQQHPLCLETSPYGHLYSVSIIDLVYKCRVYRDGSTRERTPPSSCAFSTVWVILPRLR